MVRKKRQNIFMGQDYGMPYCKESETKISLQFILFINASPIPTKSQAKPLYVEKTKTKENTQKRYGRIHVKKQVKGIESNLAKFHFLSQILISKLIFYPS